MFNETKEIIVVVSSQYEKIGRGFAHEISKQPGCNAALWSIEQYKQNEFQLGGSRYAIFVGTEKENNLTKDFLPLIKDISSNAGICYGFDGSKAVLFGTGNLEQEEDFAQLCAEVWQLADSEEEVSQPTDAEQDDKNSTAKNEVKPVVRTALVVGGVALLAPVSITTLAAATGISLLMPKSIKNSIDNTASNIGKSVANKATSISKSVTSFVTKPKREQDLREKQMLLAFILFMNNHFMDWLA